MFIFISSSANVNEFNVRERRDLAAYSALSKPSGSLGRSSSNCSVAQSCLRRPTEKVAATSFHISESAGKMKEVVSSSLREKGFLSSGLDAKTASATLVAKGLVVSNDVVNIVNPPFSGLMRVLRH